MSKDTSCMPSNNSNGCLSINNICIKIYVKKIADIKIYNTLPTFIRNKINHSNGIRQFDHEKLVFSMRFLLD